MENESWREEAPPVHSVEAGINPPHLQRLRYNPDYYFPTESDLAVGDEIVIGQYASNSDGSPNIRWTEVKITGLPLVDFYPTLVYFMKRKTNKNEKKEN